MRKAFVYDVLIALHEVSSIRNETVIIVSAYKLQIAFPEKLVIFFARKRECNHCNDCNNFSSGASFKLGISEIKDEMILIRSF